MWKVTIALIVCGACLVIGLAAEPAKPKIEPRAVVMMAAPAYPRAAAVVHAVYGAPVSDELTAKTIKALVWQAALNTRPQQGQQPSADHKAAVAALNGTPEQQAAYYLTLIKSIHNQPRAAYAAQLAFEAAQAESPK